MSSHFINGIFIISAPHNMGVDTWFVQLSSLLTDIWPKIECSVMAVLICIKRVCGTFCQLVNIANRFLRIFSNIEASIRFIFPGGAGYPYLPTRLYGLDEWFWAMFEPTWTWPNFTFGQLFMWFGSNNDQIWLPMG